MSKPLPGYPLLRAMAEVAFNRGLIDGQVRRSPRPGKQVMDQLYQTFPSQWEECSWRIFHRFKLRKVYIAGFDLARMHQTLKEKP